MLYLRLLVAALFASVRARRDLVLENLALRHQLAVYTRGRRRPRLRRHDRRLWSLLARGWSGWRGTLVMVEPDTVVRWHRSAWRAYWRWKSRRRSGRPRIPAELRQLIVRIATEHPRWGAVRIVGELLPDPGRVRMLRDVPVPDAASVVVDHDEHVERAEGERLDREQIGGPDAGRVVAEKRAPRLARGAPQRLPAVATHGAGADLEAKGTQLADDADGRGTA